MLRDLVFTKKRVENVPLKQCVRLFVDGLYNKKMTDDQMWSHVLW